MRKLYLLIAVFLCCLTVASAQPQKGLRDLPESVFIDSFLISSRPVTNREYLIYLVWLYENYPDYQWECIYREAPGKKIQLPQNAYDNLSAFEVLFHSMDPMISNYMFNPRYIDYPVVGVNWWQANKYCRWLSDRINEKKMIASGMHKISKRPYPFNTEAFIFYQYEQLSQSDASKMPVKDSLFWEKNYCMPSLRMPSAKELSAFATATQTEQIALKSYPSERRHILNELDKKYLRVNGDSLEIKLKLYRGRRTVFNKFSYDKPLTTEKEMTLDADTSGNISEIYLRCGFHIADPSTLFDYPGYSGEVDSMGHAPFIVIGQNKNKTPIAIDLYNYSPVSTYLTRVNRYSTFRYAVSMRRGEYKIK